MNIKESSEYDQKASLLREPAVVTTHLRRPNKKVLLLGFNNVGKSAIALKYVFDYFQENGHSSTIEETYKKTVKYRQKSCLYLNFS